MKQGIAQAIRGDRLGLTDLLEKLAAAGLCFSDVLLPGQTFRIRVAGWSMAPALRTGDQITVEPASPVELQVGDLLLFHDHGRLICHRLVDMQDTGAGPRLITKGDAETECDAPLQLEHVLGRVVGIRPSWLARLRDKVAQGLLALQGLRSYRRTMRALLSRGLAYYVGIPEGSQWISYHPIPRRDGDPIALNGRRDFYLLAKLGGTSVGSLQVKAVADGYRIENLYVRIRYRGMGAGSKLLALAATAASRSRPPVLLASVVPTNTAALHLFTKAGFRKTGGLHGNQVSLQRDL